MVNNTANLGLLKPTEDELYSIDTANQNMDLIDTNIKNLQDGQTASEILTKLKTVDGSGSGLDADTVKGYVPINSGIITASNDFIIGSGSSAVVKKTLAETKTILGIDAATETAKGVVELATAAETTTGTDATRAVHPAGLKVELDKKLGVSAKAADSNLFDGMDSTAFSKSNTSFTGTTDFNTLRDIGVYQGADITNCVNKPPGAFAYGLLTVDVSGGYFIQTYISIYNDIYTRCSSNGGTVWTGWNRKSTTIMGTLTIPITGWLAASGVVPYLWYIDISLPGALATDKIDIDVTYPYLQQAVVAQLGPTEERADAVRILAVNIPTVAVQARYTIFR